MFKNVPVSVKVLAVFIGTLILLGLFDRWDEPRLRVLSKTYVRAWNPLRPGSAQVEIYNAGGTGIVAVYVVDDDAKQILGFAKAPIAAGERQFIDVPLRRWPSGDAWQVRVKPYRAGEDGR